MGVMVREKPKGSSVWWVFIAHQGRRRSKRVGVGPKGKKAADLAAIQLRAKLAGGDVTVLSPSPALADVPTFGDVAQEWLRKYPALRTLAPGTLDNYRSFTEQHLLPHFGAKPITALTPTAIEDFIEAKRGPGGSVRFEGKSLSDGSLKTGLLTLRLILQRAVRLRLLPANPMHDVEWRGLPRPETVDPFTTRELRAILAAAHEVHPNFAVMLRLWAQSGMRAGEVAGLQWQDLDLERGTALVRRTWSRGRLGPTKTRRDRTVSILHPVADPVADWRPGVTAEARSLLAGLRGLPVRHLEPEAFVFGDGRTPLSSMEVHRLWRRVLAKARVRYRAPEQLRHTFASTMLSRNAPLLYVQQQGGWRSASVLLLVYARWLPQDVGGMETGLSAPSLHPVPFTGAANMGVIQP